MRGERAWRKPEIARTGSQSSGDSGTGRLAGSVGSQGSHPRQPSRRCRKSKTQSQANGRLSVAEAMFVQDKIRFTNESLYCVSCWPNWTASIKVSRSVLSNVFFSIESLVPLHHCIFCLLLLRLLLWTTSHLFFCYLSNEGLRKSKNVLIGAQ